MKKKYLPVVVAVIGILVGYVLLDVGNFGDIAYEIGGIIEIFSIILFCVAFCMLFVNDEIYNIWLNFSVWWLPIAMFIVFKTSTGGALPPGNRAMMSMLLLGGFLVISFLIVILKASMKRKK